MKNIINIVLIAACFLVGQNLMAQGATLSFNGQTYAVDFTMSIDQGQFAAMDIEISKPMGKDDKAFTDALGNAKAPAIKSMTLTQVQKNGTVKLTLTIPEVVAFQSGEQTKSKVTTVLIVSDRLDYEFSSKQGRNAFSHDFNL